MSANPPHSFGYASGLPPCSDEKNVRQPDGLHFISDSLNALRRSERSPTGSYRPISQHHPRTLLLTRVLLGRFPMRPVPQSASSCGLASWTGQYFRACSPRVCLGASCPRFSVTFIMEHFYLSMAYQIDRVKNRRPFPARETRKALLDRTSASVLWSA